MVRRDEYGREREESSGEVWGVDPAWVDAVMAQAFTTGASYSANTSVVDEAAWQEVRGRIEADLRDSLKRLKESSDAETQH
jgi:hypothetical protein